MRDRDAYPFFNSEKSSICVNLHCRTPNRPGFFFAGPALGGTDCGEGNWCDGGSCVQRDIQSLTTTTTKKSITQSSLTTTKITTTTPISLTLSTWSSWTKQKCNSECLKFSKGMQVVSRKCTIVGSCEGSSESVEICDDRSVCSTRKSVIEYGTQKCREFSRRVSNVDAKSLGLQANYDPLRLWMPCAIFCKHKNSSSYITPRIELNQLGIDPYFPDGTWCNRQGNEDYFCLKHHCLPEVISIFKCV